MTIILQQAKEGKEIKVDELMKIDFKWLVYELYSLGYSIVISNGFLKAEK